MALKSGQLDAQQHAYLIAHGSPPDEILEALAKETVAHAGPLAKMQVAPELGALLTLLARLIDARFVVEVGTFTGYSSICLARGLAAGGRLLTCDVDETWTAIARRYWEKAGVADRIELRLGPAIETLGALPDEATIDLAFIDADKDGYLDYWEELVPRTRPGGLLVVDNVLFGGQAANPDATGNAAAIRGFNDHALADHRVDRVMLPVGDGVTLARVRGA